jgi:hypothetical protein
MTHVFEKHKYATDKDMIIDKRNNTITFITSDYPAFVNNTLNDGMYKWFFFFYFYFLFFIFFYFFSDFMVVSKKYKIRFLFLFLL